MGFWSKRKKQAEGQAKQIAETLPRTAGEELSLRYCSADFVSVSAGHQWRLIRQREGEVRLLPAQMTDLLNHCQNFRTLADHAENYQQRTLSGQRPSERIWIESIIEQLMELTEAGLLVSDHAFLNSLKPVAPEALPPRIATAGLITHNRPEGLKRGLLSFIENSRRFGRNNDFVVMDDSEEVALRNETREMLRTLKAEYGISLSYAGLEEKQQFAEALIRNSDVPPEVIRFALFDEARTGFTAGANRNALLLHTVGDLALSADDDMLCRIVAPANADDNLALASGDELLDYQFHPDHDSLLRSVDFIEQDILAIHERLLGREVKGCVCSHGADRLNRDYTSPQFVQRLRSGADKVIVTFTGLAGDAGVSSPIQYLLLRPALRQRVVESEHDYRSVCASREIVRRASSAVITDQPWGFQTGAFGYDNRRLLPPFLPVMQGQDGLFGITLRECFRQGCIGHLPQSVVHAPMRTRKFDQDSLQRHAQNLSLVSLIVACLASSQGMPKPVDEKERLRSIGNHLMQVGSLPLSEYEEFVCQNVWQLQGSFASVIEDQLRYYAETPDYWADDLKAYLDNLYEAMTNSDYIIPHDLLSGRSRDEARQLSQRLLYQFGQLLYWWPEIVKAAGVLRSRGQRLALPV
jgi:hypothetical protein